MPVELTPVSLAEISVLRNLMELYRYDFSEIEHDDVDQHGLFGYAYLDHYLTDEARSAFLVHVDGELAGFVLVRRVDDGTMSISEFFVMRAYRRRGIGSSVAREVFRRFPGRWRFFALAENSSALSFWRTVLTGMSNVTEEEGEYDDEPVVYFSVEQDAPA